MPFIMRLEEISGIEPLTFPAVNAGKPPAAAMIEMQEVSGCTEPISKRKQPPFGDCFFLVEISGIEPLTS